MSDEVVKRPPRIRYALANNEGSRIEGFGGAAITRPASRGLWSEDSDNPLSPNFIPPEERGENAKARWWALHGRKNSRPTHGEYDAKPAQSG